MNSDISQILREWGYRPGHITARWIVGRDGRLKVQLRLDLGILQMEVEGRPDGQRPRGFESWLQYFEAQDRSEEPLSEQECMDLQQEALQYYYRYIAFSALRHYEGVIRDTEHNLAILRLVEQRVSDEETLWSFLQFYPYVRMMNARAYAEKALAEKRDADAIAQLQSALDDIRIFRERYGEDEEQEVSPELEILSELLDQLREARPVSRREQLREELRQAIEHEQYERAAELRDQLRAIGDE